MKQPVARKQGRGAHDNIWPDAAATPFRGEKNTNWERGLAGSLPGPLARRLKDPQGIPSPRKEVWSFSDDGDLTALRSADWKFISMEQKTQRLFARQGDGDAQARGRRRPLTGSPDIRLPSVSSQCSGWNLFASGDIA